MRLDRIKAYLIDLLVIFIFYTLINALVPQSDALKRYKAAERELHENYIE